MVSEKEIEAAIKAIEAVPIMDDTYSLSGEDAKAVARAALEAAARVRAEDNAGEPVEEACDIFLVSAMVEKPGMAGHRARVGRFASKEEAIGSSLELWQVDGWSVRSYECAPCNNLLSALTAGKPEPASGTDYFGSLVERARASATKASAKFPQPNYVTLKIAEEAGEVIRGAVHYAERRMEWSEVEGEIIQLLAMLIRFVTEGDQVNGIVPPTLPTAGGGDA